MEEHDRYPVMRQQHNIKRNGLMEMYHNKHGLTAWTALVAVVALQWHDNRQPTTTTDEIHTQRGRGKQWSKFWVEKIKHMTKHSVGTARVNEWKPNRLR